MGFGKLHVTPELFADLMKFPEGTELVGAEWRFHDRRLVLYVTHPDLKKVPEGQECPLVNAEYYECSDGAIRFKEWVQ